MRRNGEEGDRSTSKELGVRSKEQVVQIATPGSLLSAPSSGNGPVPFPGGFTLLEIILALAILAGSLAALGEVMRLADQNATMTRDESQAQILAASIMDELIAGARDLVAIDRGQFDFVTDPP